MTRFDIDKPLWDLSTFLGRVRHYFWVTDPRTVLTSKADLYRAKGIVDTYRAGDDHPERSRTELIRAKQLVESSFHPDTGELQHVCGRMAFQMPSGVAIMVALLTCYKSTPAVIFWQWVNQSLNALVNYTNRNAASDLTTPQIMSAYVSATTSAVTVSVGLKKMLARTRHPILQRLVPFAAVSVANMVNIPLMRQNELKQGVFMKDEAGREVCNSKLAAVKAISQVTFSRISMAVPSMLFTPLIMNQLEKAAFYRPYARSFNIPAQAIIVGCWCIIVVPVGCALFPQKCAMRVETIRRWEPEQFERIRRRYGTHSLPNSLYFNKGL